MSFAHIPGAASCKKSIRKNNPIRKNKSTRRYILYLKADPSYIQIGANKFGIEKFLKIKLVQVLVKHPLECLDNTPMMTTKNKTKSLQIILFTTNPL